MKRTPVRIQQFSTGEVMARYITILALAIFLSGIGGCDNNPVQAPLQNNGQETPLQLGLKLPVLQIPLLNLNVQLLSLPGSILSIGSGQFSTQSMVTAQSGGTLNLNCKYSTFLIFKFVTISSTFTVDPGAITRDQLITMTLDKTNMGFDFDPQGLQFSKPAHLSCTATGLDLSSVPSGTSVELFYCNTNGTYEEIPSGSISYDVATGTVTCSNAQISHFSQYAFGYIKK